MAIEYSSSDKKSTAQKPPKKKASGADAPIAKRNNLVNSSESSEDSRNENSIRPGVLDEYIGQSQLKESIQISLKAAQNRGEPLEHLLFYGPPGLGKTTLSMVIAHEMGTNIHLTSAPALERPRDIIGILMALEPGSVLFIDEIHRLNKVTEEVLYPVMEDFRLDRTVGKGHSAKILQIPLPPFTLIGATTKAGAIAGPLRDRFGMVCRLQFYTDDELVGIINRSAGILGIEITGEGALHIAKRARGTPRIANRLLRRVRDYVEVKHPKAKTIDGTGANAALDFFEIDQLGLDMTDRQLLETMINQFHGGPVGIESLASSLGEEVRTIEDVYEPYLLQAGLIHRTPRGRVITKQALAHLGIDPARAPGMQQALF